MITKSYITDLKRGKNGEIAALIESQKDAGTINTILESLGQLPANFDGNFLYELLEHPHPQVRLNAVKNIGKLNGKSKIIYLYELYKKEVDTGVKREIISAIGRQRKSENKPFLFETLSDGDPKIICQAIRALLVFERDKDVEEHLKPLINHPNEMVRTVIYKEYFAKENKTTDNLPHAETYNYLKNIVVNADVLEVLKFVPNESVHLTFTSQPYYHARDYFEFQKI
jgi:hypothetical protein